jgi:hypothetical protein
LVKTLSPDEIPDIHKGQDSEADNPEKVEQEPVKPGQFGDVLSHVLKEPRTAELVQHNSKPRKVLFIFGKTDSHQRLDSGYDCCWRHESSQQSEHIIQDAANPQHLDR